MSSREKQARGWFVSYKVVALYGIAIWVFVFIVAIFAFPLRANERPLFESIMPVALALAVTAVSVRCLRSAKEQNANTGLRLGLIWLAINIAIDLVMFSWGPMKMPLLDYLKDIGVTYLMIPIIPVGLGYALHGKAK